MIKGEKTKKEILQKTKEIIFYSGYENLTVRKIAQKINLSFTLIYKYFSNLDDLLWQIRTQIIKDLIDYILLSAKDNDPKDNLKISLKKYVDFMQNNPNYFRFLFFKSFRINNKKEYQDLIASILLINKNNLNGFDSLDKGASLKKAIYAIHGLLLLYISKSEEIDIDNFDKDLNIILEGL